ncbi:WD repeat domain-containing protein 83 [Nymphon striatum]|nr:WD repeat domain-containing protein 83 [Nymphon striatum]
MTGSDLPTTRETCLDCNQGAVRSVKFNDLPSSLAPASVNFPSDIPINCPLYADDTCLIADTADELQLSLDSLTEYCKINHLIINVSKSKVVVFHKVDGNYCLTCGSDKTLKLWNPFSGTLLQTFSGHGYEVLDAQGSCDNSQLVSCGLDKTAILWDVSTAVPLRKFRGHAAKVNCVRFNEESSVILTGSLDCTVRIWDCRSKSRDPVQTLDEAKDSITSLEVSDHEIVTGSLDCALRRYDIRVGQICLDSTIKLIDQNTGELLGEYTGHKNDEFMIEISSKYMNWLFELFHLMSTINHKLEHPGSRVVHSLSFHPSKPILLTATGAAAYLWKAEDSISN